MNILPLEDLPNHFNFRFPAISNTNMAAVPNVEIGEQLVRR
jgi:hypothetical protein